MTAEQDKRRADAMRLAAESGCDPRTAKRWLAGEGVSTMSEKALRSVASKLGIDGPETVD